jgi:signal transduction histidine kinase
MKLRTKLGLVLAAVMLVLSGVVLGSIQLFRMNTVQQERADIHETANLTAAQIEQQLSERQNSVSDYAIRAESLRPGERSQFLTEFINATGFFRAQLIAANGTVVGFRGSFVTPEQRREVIGSDVSDSDHYERSIQGRRYVSRPEKVSGESLYVVLFSAPIGLPSNISRNATGGVLVGASILDASPGSGDSFSSPNRNLGVFASTSTLRRESQTVTVVGTNASGDRAVLLRPHREFNRSLSESAFVGTTSWQVTVVRDRSRLSERLGDLQLIQGVGLLIVFGSILGLARYEYTTNLTQTDKLIEGFGALQEGDFDYSLDLRGAEEWTRISEGFNEMTTGLREREQGIREREQRLGVLNRVLRHNLQNDMSVILTYAEMLPQLGDDEQDDAIETILSKGQGLVAHGKKARQIEKAMETAEEGLVKHDLAGMVEETLAELRDEFPDATVENELPESLPAAGVESLRFAVESVAENALEHNDGDDPRLTVSADVGGGVVELRFTDNGPGIPEYEQQVVSEAEETDLEHGSGLGLFLATWVTEKSDGEISFETREDGTTATLTLPAPDAVTEERRRVAPV